MKYTILFFIILLPLNGWSTRIDLDYDPGDFEESFDSQIRGCSSQQTVKVLEAEKNVRLRLEQLSRDWALVDLKGVKRDFVDPENRIWIPNGPKNVSYQTYWQDMGLVLRQMKEKADRGLNFQCQTARDKHCDGVIAYVMVIFGRPRQMIYLCPSFFEDGSYETTILHELSHYASSTEDYALDWWNLEKSDLKKGARDAYHIEGFMRQEVPTYLRKTIWLWWWPKPKSGGSVTFPFQVSRN